MVVEARLLPSVPADQPDVDVRLAVQLQIEAAVTLVVHVLQPEIGPPCNALRQHLQLAHLEVATGRRNAGNERGEGRRAHAAHRAGAALTPARSCMNSSGSANRRLISAGPAAT